MEEELSMSKEAVNSTVNNLELPLVSPVDLPDEKPLTDEQREKLMRLANMGMEYLPPEARSVLTGFLIGGLQGGLDAAAMLGLDKLPPTLRDIAKDLLDTIKLEELPSQVFDIVTSFFSDAGDGLNSVLNKIAGGINIESLDLGAVFEKITRGDFGDIARLLGDLGNIPFLSSLLPGTGIINTVSTVLGLFDGGISNIFSNLLSSNGFGLTNVLNFFGVGSTITGLIGPLLKLFGLGGNINSKCPCHPSCRKTDHFITEDEVKLLEKCSSIIPNSSSTYLPRGIGESNNENPFSQALGLVNTALGESLIPSNIFNLTEFITGTARVGDMAKRVESARNADFPDWQNELVYTFKAVENSFKVMDNNTTKIEEIIGLFLKSGIFSQLFNRKKDKYIFDVLQSLTLAVNDLQRQTTTLDQVKVGGYAGAMPTEPIIKSKKHAELIKYINEANDLDWLKILEYMEVAMKIWNLLKPGPSGAEAQIVKDLENEENNNYLFPDEIKEEFENLSFENNDYSSKDYFTQVSNLYNGISETNFPEVSDQEEDFLREGSSLDDFWSELETLNAPGEIYNKFKTLEKARQSNLDWDELITKKLLKNPELVQSKFADTLKNIYTTYEQERITRKENYC